MPSNSTTTDTTTITTTNTPKRWRDVLPIHPAAELFPLMSETDPAALRELAADIEKHGMRVFITLIPVSKSPIKINGTPVVLLDGRNRLDALELAGYVIDFEQMLAVGKNTSVGPQRILWTIQPDTDPYERVLSLNVHRRHLTTEQKRDLIAKLLKAKPETSNLQIAKQAKADDKTVAKVRTKLEATSEIPKLDRLVGSDGRSRAVRQPAEKTAAAAEVIEQRREARVAEQEKARARRAAREKREEFHADISRFAYKLIQLDIDLARELHNVLVYCGGDAIQLMDDLAAGIDIEAKAKADDGLDIPPELRRVAAS